MIREGTFSTRLGTISHEDACTALDRCLAQKTATPALDSHAGLKKGLQQALRKARERAVFTQRAITIGLAHLATLYQDQRGRCAVSTRHPPRRARPFPPFRPCGPPQDTTMTTCLPSWAMQPVSTLMISGTVGTSLRPALENILTALPFGDPKRRVSPLDTRTRHAPLITTTPRGHDEAIMQALHTFRIFQGLTVAFWWEPRSLQPDDAGHHTTPGFALQPPKGLVYHTFDLPTDQAIAAPTQDALVLLADMLRTPLLVGDSKHAQIADMHSLRPTP